ncbi:hypothetical protein SDC9_198140 [bioreactor metagenome]|uniref:Uncharacterized protein n=1 Tax=bioreactor metagenome TaxID=1076179 RepID=A0A645ITM9_9ZZZZ
MISSPIPKKDTTLYPVSLPVVGSGSSLVVGLVISAVVLTAPVVGSEPAVPVLSSPVPVGEIQVVDEVSKVTVVGSKPPDIDTAT